MREILFRGKQLDDGEWVEGWYEMYPFGKWPVKTSIIPSEEAKDGHYKHVQVDHSTVGQYTGLKDKNGKRIFEGDILSLRTGRPHVVMFEDGSFVLENTAISVRFANKFEVIGNIHDNPELLEGVDE